MPIIGPDEVRKIADLARLRLTDAEASLFAGQLMRILDFMRQLEAVDTSAVAPLAGPLASVDSLRDDQPRPGLSAAQALANAPERHGDLFKVPPVLG